MKNCNTQNMCDFIQQNPTAFHTVAGIAAKLDEAGYERLAEADSWTIEPGHKYYVTRNGSSILAFAVGSHLEKYSYQIVASHSDSPCYKIKENAELKMEGCYTRLNTEGYGGMILSTWLDRPLSIAGRVLVADGQTIASRLINFDRDLVLIPNVAVHMNREANNGYKFNQQVDMMPLFAGSTDGISLKSLVAKELGVEEDQILGSDLYVYNRQPGSIWGVDQEFVSSPRLDDQQCAYASVMALLSAEAPTDQIQVLACFDNEEVGSGTRQGACSTFMKESLARISAALGKTAEEHICSLASSFMLSADNAHAVHPNHPELTDGTNKAYMNQGVVVKSHAGQKYTSDGMSIAVVRMLAARAGVPLQYFANRSDKAGGSTLGNLSQAQVSVKAADIGIAQLAMHSSYETAGVKDTEYMISLMKELYNSSFLELADGSLKIR